MNPSNPKLEIFYIKYSEFLEKGLPASLFLKRKKFMNMLLRSLVIEPDEYLKLTLRDGKVARIKSPKTSPRISDESLIHPAQTSIENLQQKKLKVSSKYFPRPSGTGVNFPSINLSGKWLQELGFEISRSVIITYEEGKIVPTTNTTAAQ